MDWKTLIAEIRLHGLTYQAIADEVGTSRGAVHDLSTGRGKTVGYETGALLVRLHKRLKRRKAKP